MLTDVDLESGLLLFIIFTLEDTYPGFPLVTQSLIFHLLMKNLPNSKLSFITLTDTHVLLEEELASQEARAICF